MIRTFRYPLRPTVAQAEILEKWRIMCQQLYNGALEERREGFRRGIRINYYTQNHALAELRQTDAEWRDLPSDIARSAIRRLDYSFRRFFDRVKLGQAPGYPRFKSKIQYKSFSLGDRHRIIGNRLHVPKLGWVKFHLYREIRGKVLNVSLKREAKGWFLYAQCYTGEAPEKVPVRTMVGIDVGLNLLAVTSDGKTIENPRFFRRSEDELARRQKSWKRKRSGSASCRRASNLVSKTREHIANQRLDHARKVAKQLVEQYDLIAYESLTIANMARWGNLGKSVNDAGWAILLKAIASKAEEAGKHAVAVVSRGTSLNCSGCGQRVDKDLSVRVHSCPCGLVIDRDLNAARNVLALGRSAVVVS